MKRVAIASTALSMGVNFPDVRYVVLFGPARSLLDFHQEAGRAGRDGLSANVILYFYGQQLTHCEEEVRDFLKTSGCYRVSSESISRQNWQFHVTIYTLIDWDNTIHDTYHRVVKNLIGGGNRKYRSYGQAVSRSFAARS